MPITSFIGDAAPRSLDGTSAALAVIGCDRPALESVIHVETGGHGFDRQNRPRALFEPHLFYRALTGAARDRAVAAGLAYPVWGTHPYPTDSYPRILAAMAIDEEAALRSASWGMGQLLGSNCRAAGYPTAAALVAAFVAGGEDEHLAAMARFIVASHLAHALATHDWAAFAAGYNGPAYRRNNYDGLLGAAYRLALAGLPKLPEHHLTPAVKNAAIPAAVVATPVMPAAPVPAPPSASPVATVPTPAPGLLSRIASFFGR